MMNFRIYVYEYIIDKANDNIIIILLANSECGQEFSKITVILLSHGASTVSFLVTS